MATEEKVLKAYKGFDSELKCRGFQYEAGKTYKHDGNVVLCKSGFHAIPDDEPPLNVFGYYPPAKSRYCEVECGGETVKDDCKVSCSEIKIGAEIGILGLVKAHVAWVKKNITNENNAEKDKPATAGDGGAATAGYFGAATAGDCGAATSRGSASAGKNGMASVRGSDVKAKGGLGAVLVIVNENNNNYDIKEWKAEVVDGERIKADTWHKLVDGKFVECNG